MSRVDIYMAKYHKHVKGTPRENIWDIMEIECELDELWNALTPKERFEVRTNLGLVREDEK